MSAFQSALASVLKLVPMQSCRVVPAATVIGTLTVMWVASGIAVIVLRPVGETVPNVTLSPT